MTGGAIANAGMFETTSTARSTTPAAAARSPTPARSASRAAAAAPPSAPSTSTTPAASSKCSRAPSISPAAPRHRAHQHQRRQEDHRQLRYLHVRRGVSLTGAGKVEVSAGGTLTVNTPSTSRPCTSPAALVNGSGNVGASTGQLDRLGRRHVRHRRRQGADLRIRQPADRARPARRRSTARSRSSAAAPACSGAAARSTSAPAASINNGGIFESTADTIAQQQRRRRGHVHELPAPSRSPAAPARRSSPTSIS